MFSRTVLPFQCVPPASLHAPRLPLGALRAGRRPAELVNRFACRAVSDARSAVDSGPYQWTYKETDFTIAVDVVGEGEPVLVLPALSTVSSRGEVSDIVSKLKDSYQVITLDWPGFGDSTREPVEYDGDLLYTFLANFVKERFSGPIRVVGCGHSASIVIKLAAASPDAFSHASLVAPTWAAPFRIMNVNPTLRDLARSALQAPLLGPALFGALSSEENLVNQYKSHVFTSDELLTDAFVASKRKVTAHPNARFGASAFVTGQLDVVEDREQVLGWLRSAKADIQLVIGNETRKRTAAEMNAMAEVEGLEVARIPGGLGMHEEFGGQVAEAILPFLTK